MSSPSYTAPEPGRWDAEIRAFERQDAREAPPRDGVVFIGSSSIALWQDAQRDFPFIPLIRRGFGGSIIEESTHYADRIVIPYAPRLVVFYAGDNDLAHGKTSDEVFADFKAFTEKVWGSLPTTKIAFVSIKFSPCRWHLKDEITRANKLIREYTETDKRLFFVDLSPVLLNEDGEPRKELYVEDMLHPNREGYKAWTSILAPFLRQNY